MLWIWLRLSNFQILIHSALQMYREPLIFCKFSNALNFDVHVTYQHDIGRNWNDDFILYFTNINLKSVGCICIQPKSCKSLGYVSVGFEHQDTDCFFVF